MTTLTTPLPGPIPTATTQLWNSLQISQTGKPDVAVLQRYAYATGLNKLSDTTFLGSTAHFYITSGYRNPAAEVAAAAKNGVRAYMNSRHLAGDALDFRTGGDRAYWRSIRDAAVNLGACVESVYVQTPKGQALITIMYMWTGA